MRLGKFFTSKSQMNKQLASDTANSLSSTAASGLPNKRSVVSTVEHRFKRMTEAHDRIRTAVLSSRWQNSR